MKTKDFWERVKRNFENSYECYLCHVDSDFAQEWEENDDFAFHCLDLAGQFLEKNPQSDIKVGNIFISSLFRCCGGDLIRRSIRLDFLNWIIETQY